MIELVDGTEYKFEYAKVIYFGKYRSSDNVFVHNCMRRITPVVNCRGIETLECFTVASWCERNKFIINNIEFIITGAVIALLIWIAI